jgi:hypothetical protein
LDRPILTLVAFAPNAPLQNASTLQTIEQMTRECGTSSRTFKSALIWCVADTSSTIYDEARKVLAWEDIESEAGGLRLDEAQQRQLKDSLHKAKRDIAESVWRTYKNIVLLDKDNKLRTVDLGFVTSSAATSLTNFIINRLRQDGDVQEAISPNFLARNWSPVHKEWSTEQVRDAFFASPQFPRLLNADAIKETIARGVSGGQMAYVGKVVADYDPFWYNKSIVANEVEISDDVYIVSKETAEQYKKAKTQPVPPEPPPSSGPGPKPPTPTDDEEDGGVGATTTTNLKWEGEVPAQKWMTFYNKVLSKYAVGSGLKIRITIEANSDAGISSQKVDETKVALRELGLNDDLTIG